MNIRIVKKAFGLLIADVVIIIGIFVLQFRTDSSIIKKISGLQVTLAQTEHLDEIVLKNKLRISYNGLNIFCDDQNPAQLTLNNSERKDLILTGWENDTPLSFRFAFSNDVNLLVKLSSEDASAAFSITASLPDDAISLSLPYNFSTNTKISSEASDYILIEGKKDSWTVKASNIASNKLYLTNQDTTISYAIYTETNKFTFEDLVDLPYADELIFKKNIDTFKSNLLAAYKANSSETNVSEQVAISYIAAMAERGAYNQALEEIPQSLKKGKQRTFLSAPFFGSLEEMNPLFENSIKDYERRISDSANTGNLDIFTASNISGYLCIHSNPAVVQKLLQKAADANLAEATISQVTGIMQVYENLSELAPEYAAILQPSMEKCIQRITDACSFENNILTVSENDTFLSVIQAVETGIAILKYGRLIDNVTLQKAGFVLVNSYMAEASSFDLRTLANLYPILAYDNTYLPHFKIIRNDSTLAPLIAWTCTKSLNYIKEADGNLQLNIGFAEGETQYLICRGIPVFSRIYIYDMLYRTDPRFETYNSSGYVYKAGTNTLLLKSRHKAETEVIRFEFN